MIRKLWTKYLWWRATCKTKIVLGMPTSDLYFGGRGFLYKNELWIITGRAKRI